ncbi:2',3'-cyclic-nucleotide 2'-phosphodiesterase/5'-or 3'-nucleotidase, 5'-nucleotidase family [Paenibacillus sp. UNCCL117]|uniref:bifunctional metallophosphatase/5'-nucleotidase n=1 Tax=unclassified Paenibacillus TaxID=185978 RepID=UPI0008836E2B|nr:MULTISPECIES: bifunctional UDP-sugar hydrolase/5'-nucleotidase [unclassified Paenibacillus]SDC07276.1 2',3'-cyclic-nucleotide 2'-phosphodiesterase/5'-or 3'-nucleotidase, 5'-nucleotidase family [Paenibacillus sp. cl123]SFW38009.1 2',3'-cyclic-nucleotide 2'-phosphodiesterase/5'-or 3'-nucleotidase, 5'-nucleotidase family [Paenibacillus sp. UNCCL117]
MRQIAEQQRKLRIVHTNDIHSHVDRMGKIAGIIRKLREEAGERHTLTLDIGDHIDRMRPETEGTDGGVNVAVLNATGYDAVTLGNNEGLTYTPDVLQKLYAEQAQFTVVLGNMFEASTGLVPAWAKPWHLLERGGLRIGLIGATAAFSEFYRLLGWEARDPFATIGEAVRELRPQADLLIVLSHLGLRNDERLAEVFPDIDVILGGHTHHLLSEPLIIGKTVIGATGKFGQYVGYIDLEVDTKQGTVSAAGGGVLETAGLPGDPEIEALLEGYARLAQDKLKREVAYIGMPLPIDWHGEAPLGNLLASGLKRWVGAELAIVNTGQLLAALPAGPVSAGDLLDLCPSPINPCRLKLTGEQILRALEESLLPEFQDKPIIGFGFRGKVLGSLAVAGMRVEYDPQAQPYSRIVSVYIGETPLQLQHDYSVATIDMFTFGIGYLSIGQGVEPEFYLPEFIRDVLLQELLDPEALHESEMKRWIECERS